MVVDVIQATANVTTVRARGFFWGGRNKRRRPPSLLSKLAANHAGGAILRNRCFAGFALCCLGGPAVLSRKERPQCSRAPPHRDTGTWSCLWQVWASFVTLVEGCAVLSRSFCFQPSPHFHLFSTPHHPGIPFSLIFLQCLVAAVGHERCVCRPVKCHGRNKRKGGGRERKSVQMFFISLRMRALCTTVACMCDSAEEKKRVHD